MRDEDYLNRLRALTNQQNVPLRVNPAQKPQIPQQYTPTFNQPRIETAPEPKRQPSPYSFAQQAQSFVTGAGEQLGGGLLRLAFRAVPTAARFTPFGAASYAAGKLGGRDIIGEAQRKGEELAKESERLQAAEIARLPDQAAARRGMQFGSAIKGTAEAGLMITPVGAASRAVQGTKLFQAGIKARPAISLATRVGENIVSGTPATVIGILQEVGRGNKPNIAKEALIGSAIDALIPIVGKGFNALKSKQVKNILTGITDKFTVKEVIKSLDETLPEKAIEDAAESIAKSTNVDEVSKYIDDVLAPESKTIAAIPEVPTPTIPTAPVSAAISQTVDATARELAKTPSPSAAKVAIDALFPNLDNTSKTTFADVIAKTNDPAEVKNVLQQAQRRSEELSATIRQATPEAPSPIQRQAEQAARLVEQPPVVTAPIRPVTQAATVTPTPSTVAEAVGVTNIPRTTSDTGKVFYHGTNNKNLKSIEDLKPGKKASKSSLNRVYVTENPEIAKNFGKNVIEQRLYGKHLNANEIGIRVSSDPSVDKVVAPEFSDYLTSPLLSSRDRNVFENAFVKSIPTNTIIEDTPAIHRYLESKGYTTITIPRVISDVNGPRTETIIISNKAFQPEIPTTMPVTEAPTVTPTPTAVAEAGKATAVPGTTSAELQNILTQTSPEEFKSFIKQSVKGNINNEPAVVNEVLSYQANSQSLNNYLRRTKDGKFTEGMTKDLDKAFTQTLEQPTKLYRGIRGDFEDILSGKTKTFVDKGYSSTSLDGVEARSPVYTDGIILSINAPKGQKVIIPDMYSGSVDNISQFTQQEVILPRGLEYKVNSITRTPDGRNIIIDVDIVKQTQKGVPSIKPTQTAPTPSTVQGATAETIAKPMGQPNISEVLYGTNTPSEEQGLDFIRRVSPNRLIRDYVTRPAQDFVNRIFAKAQVSGVAPIRGLGRLGTGISRELGATPELLAARKQFLQGTGEFGKIVREDIIALGKGLSDTVQQRVWATLDPELAAAKGIKVNVADLEPEELAYRNELVKIRDAITQENLDRGLINEEQAAANWFKRGYEVFDFEPQAKTAYQDTKKGLLKQFKGRKDINEELVEAAIEDPAYLLAKKAADSHAVWGMVDYGNWLVNNNLVSDVARPGYRQLPTSKIYGGASGKFVPTNIAEDFTGFQFNNAITNAFNDIITAYDNLGIRKAKKAMLTVLNPTVRLGNQLSNRVIFAQLGGINPFTFNKNFMRVKSLRANRNPLYLEAVKRGLTGLDMTQKEFTSKVAEYTGQPNLAQKAWEWAKGSYSQADDTARIAAFVTYVERGYSLDEAARLAQRAFQDYKSVGFFYDIAAKTPIIGNAFVRFAGDSARILTNALVDQPLTLAGSLTGLWALGEYMSRMSGETPDEKKTREERFGAPKVPFVNIPLEIQTPWGAVNAARFLPYYNLNEIQGNLTKFLPFAGNPLEAKNWNDPLLGQVMQLLVDKDFRGKSIAEPENVGQFRTPTPSDVALENRVRFALTQNVPLGREIDALYSAAKGQEDVYGGERSLGQAIGRLFGVKVEKFGPEQVKKLKENEAFFADKKFIDDQLATMPKDKQETFKKLTGYYKLREQVENTFEKGKMRFKKEPVYAFSEDKYKDLTSNPELYDLLMQQKVRDNQRDGKPIPPEFDTRLSNEFRRQLIENKSLRPGDDAEADERMYSSPEWDTYQTIKQEYKDKAKAFFPQTTGEFNDELVKHQNADFPEKGGAYKEYSDAYALFAKGQGPKPTFTDSVKADKDKYNQAKLDWTNKERKARGLAPISPEVWNNVTFGFTSDEEKVYNELRYGRGLGGFGFDSTSPEYKEAMAALKRAGITVKPLEIVSAAPRRVRLQRQRVPTTRRAARIRLR